MGFAALADEPLGSGLQPGDHLIGVPANSAPSEVYALREVAFAFPAPDSRAGRPDHIRDF